MAIQFDGSAKVITLESGTTDVDVSEIYSAWKRWVQESHLNAKYEPAFRTIGGDPLSSIINAGAYYFLRNDYGWRLKPPEEDITIYLTGNLAAEDTTLPTVVATDGAFTVILVGLQPVTQGVTSSMAEQLEYASFEGGTWVDQANGISGTGYINGSPIGNAANPSNNITDAVAICVARGLPKTLYVIDDLVLGAGDDVSGFQILGQNAARTTITIGTDSNTLTTAIKEAYVGGTMDGQTIIRFSAIGNLSYVSGYIYESELMGTITLGGNSQADILGCYSQNAGTSPPPIIDFGGSGQSLKMAKLSGDVTLQNKTGTDEASINLIGGSVRIDLTTVTNGRIEVNGDGKVVNEADGDYLPSGFYGNLELINDTTTGVMLHELWALQGLDPDAPMTVTPTSRSVGSITQDISGDGVNTSTVTRT